MSGRWRCSVVLAFVLCCASARAQQALPPPLRGGPPSDVPVAVQILRWHMLDDNVSTLAFRSMDQIFTTRTVPRGGPVWNLPRSDRPLDFTYTWQGDSVPAEQFLERTYTNALLVLKNGRIVSEIYRNNSGARSRFIGWSMTKSLTSVLIGCALEEGPIDSLDTPITRYLPEPVGGGYDGVSIRHVMQMRSGVDYEERYDFGNPGIAASNHIAALVRNTARFTDVARTLPRKHAPGTHFQYKTIDTAVLGWLVERATQGSVAACVNAPSLTTVAAPPATRSGAEISGLSGIFGAFLRTFGEVYTYTYGAANAPPYPFARSVLR